MSEIALPPRVYELRQYTLRAGKREALIGLFDDYFVESQEAAGIHVLGQFRDLSRPDRFVWVRGFANMESRAKALAEFYGGAIWKTHREAANTTMLDSDNVLLLRPTRPDGGITFADATRPPIGSGRVDRSIVVVQIFDLRLPVNETVLSYFERQAVPVMLDAGIRVRASFQTEPSENTFPALPVRTGEHTLVLFSTFESRAAAETKFRELEQSPEWKSGVGSGLAEFVKSASERLFLEPTARSLMP